LCFLEILRKKNKWCKLIFETWLIRKRRHWNLKLLLKKFFTHIMYKWTSSLQKLFVKCWWNWPQTSKIGRKYQKLFCCRNLHDFIRLFFMKHLRKSCKFLQHFLYVTWPTFQTEPPKSIFSSLLNFPHPNCSTVRPCEADKFPLRH